MIPIVLASASPRRRALLEALGIEVEIQISKTRETAHGPPMHLAAENACKKRDRVIKRLDKPALVIGADTIVVLHDHVLGKPKDLAEAREMLAHLSGQTHEVMTGVAVADTETGEAVHGVEMTQVTFRTLVPEEIDRFIAAVKPLDRAGAYTVDGPGALLVERYQGCYQNVLGLPIVRLDRLLRQIGHDLFQRIDGRRAQFL